MIIKGVKKWVKAEKIKLEIVMLKLAEKRKVLLVLELKVKEKRDILGKIK